MAIRIRDLVERAQDQLEDSEGSNWTPAELLAAAIEAVQELSRHPDAWLITEDFTLVAGAKQRLPETRASLEDLGRALTSTGQSAGMPTPFDLATMARFNPQWTEATPGTTRQWAKDIRDPRVFWVYPPAIAGDKVEVVVRALPPSEIDMDTELPIDSTWAPALLDFILGRAYAKDAEHAGMRSQAELHMRRAMALMGVADGADS
jgi:hypothetical protein